MSKAICPSAGRPRGEFLAGLIDIAPLVVSVVPFGLLLGSLAAQKGLSPAETAIMSATVFAGGAQFVAVELWRDPVPVATLITAAFLVNLRHVLMGAALVPHLRAHPDRHVYPALFLLADEIWALAMRRAATQPLTLVYFFGLALALYVNWVATTTLGAVIGQALEDPAAFGFDFAFTAVFLCLLTGFWSGVRSALPWVASAAVAVAAYQFLPGVWYILLGGLAGAVAGALLGGRARDA